MIVLIAASDQVAASRLRASLAKLGVEVPHSHLLSPDSAEVAVSNLHSQEKALLFFHSVQLATDDLAMLARLTAVAGEHGKVVVFGTSFSAGAILQAIRTGAADCLNLNAALESELRLVLERFQATAQERVKFGRLFTVVAPVGGTGASMLAANLAAIVACRRQACCLLDLHWRGGDLATFLNCTPRHTLLSLASKTEQLDRTMFDHSLARHSCGVHLLASPDPFSDYRQIRPELIQRIVQIARSAYSTVLVDLEDCEHLDQVRTIAASDQIIIPFRPDFLSLARARKLLSHLKSASVPPEHITVVVNRTGQPKELPLAHIQEGLGVSVRHRIPDDPAAANEAVNLGIPLVLACPKSKAAAEIGLLADSLFGPADDAPPARSTAASWLARSWPSWAWKPAIYRVSAATT